METQNPVPIAAGPEADPQISLMLAIKNNIFFDAVLASMAYTLLEEAFKISPEIKNYPYEDVDLDRVVFPQKFSIVTHPLTGNEDPMLLDDIKSNVPEVVSIIIDGIKHMLFDTATGRVVAGTMRIHLVLDGETGGVDIVLTAIKHNTES